MDLAAAAGTPDHTLVAGWYSREPGHRAVRAVRRHFCIELSVNGERNQGQLSGSLVVVDYEWGGRGAAQTADRRTPQ